MRTTNPSSIRATSVPVVVKPQPSTRPGGVESEASGAPVAVSSSSKPDGVATANRVPSGWNAAAVLALDAGPPRVAAGRRAPGPRLQHRIALAAQPPLDAEAPQRVPEPLVEPSKREDHQAGVDRVRDRDRIDHLLAPGQPRRDRPLRAGAGKPPLQQPGAVGLAAMLDQALGQKGPGRQRPGDVQLDLDAIGELQVGRRFGHAPTLSGRRWSAPELRVARLGRLLLRPPPPVVVAVPVDRGGQAVRGSRCSAASSRARRAASSRRWRSAGRGPARSVTWSKASAGSAQQLEDQLEDLAVVPLAVGTDQVGLARAALARGSRARRSCGRRRGSSRARSRPRRRAWGAGRRSTLVIWRGMNFSTCWYGPVVVRAVGDRGVDAERAHPRAHQQVRAGLGRGVRARRVVRRLRR